MSMGASFELAIVSVQFFAHPLLREEFPSWSIAILPAFEVRHLDFDPVRLKPSGQPRLLLLSDVKVSGPVQIISDYIVRS